MSYFKNIKIDSDMDEWKKRIEELKKENDEINEKLNKLEIEKINLINQALNNNGGIIELEKILKEKEESR